MRETRLYGTPSVAYVCPCLSRNQTLSKPEKQFIYKSKARGAASVSVCLTISYRYNRKNGVRGDLERKRLRVRTGELTIRESAHCRCRKISQSGCDGSAKLVASCVAQLEQQARGCPICRSEITMVLRLY